MKFPRFLIAALLAAVPSLSALAQQACPVLHLPQQPAKAVAQNGHDAKDSSRALGKLMNARLSLMTDVAKYKWNTHGSIEDPAREQKILEELNAKAEALNLPPLWVQHFFREQIEAGKLIQYQLFANWTREHAGTFSNVPDLATQIRPQIDDLTTKLLYSLADNWAVIHTGIVSPVVLDQLKANSCAAGLALLPLFDSSALAQPSIGQ
jgi:chorismate mutase